MVEKKEADFELDLMFNIDDDEDYEELDRGDEVDLDEDEDSEEDIEDIEDIEDSEDSEDEEDEDVEEDEESEEDEEDISNIKIPKSRLDEVIAQREEERERVKWLEEQLTKLIDSKPESKQSSEDDTPSYDFASAEEKYAELIIEGETSKTAKLRAEIDDARREEMISVIKSIESENEKKIESVSKQSTEQLKFDTLIEKFESKYEFLNVDSDNYNEEAVDTVNTLMAGFVASGLSKPEALQKAVTKVVPLYKSNESKELGKTRKAKSIKKSVKAAKSQPPKTRSSGTKNVDLDSIDITKLSEKEFEKLTEKEKRILRGD